MHLQLPFVDARDATRSLAAGRLPSTGQWVVEATHRVVQPRVNSVGKHEAWKPLESVIYSPGGVARPARTKEANPGPTERLSELKPLEAWPIAMRKMNDHTCRRVLGLGVRVARHCVCSSGRQIVLACLSHIRRAGRVEVPAAGISMDCQ